MTSRESKVVQPFLTACRQALMITVAAVVLGLMVNALRPQGLDLIRPPDPVSPATTAVKSAGPQPINLEDTLERLKNQSAIIIDARSEFDYAAGHMIPPETCRKKTSMPGCRNFSAPLRPKPPSSSTAADRAASWPSA